MKPDKCILCGEIVLEEMGAVISPNGDWVAHMECVFMYKATMDTKKGIKKRERFGN